MFCRALQEGRRVLAESGVFGGALGVHLLADAPRLVAREPDHGQDPGVPAMLIDFLRQPVELLLDLFRVGKRGRPGGEAGGAKAT